MVARLQINGRISAGLFDPNLPRHEGTRESFDASSLHQHFVQSDAVAVNARSLGFWSLSGKETVQNFIQRVERRAVVKKKDSHMGSLHTRAEVLGRA